MGFYDKVEHRVTNEFDKMSTEELRAFIFEQTQRHRRAVTDAQDQGSTKH